MTAQYIFSSGKSQPTRMPSLTGTGLRLQLLYLQRAGSGGTSIAIRHLTTQFKRWQQANTTISLSCSQAVPPFAIPGQFSSSLLSLSFAWGRCTTAFTPQVARPIRALASRTGANA